MSPNEALTQTIDKFQISILQLSFDAKLCVTQVYYYKDGKKDFVVKNWLKLVQALPDNARFYYLGLVFPGKPDQVF